MGVSLNAEKTQVMTLTEPGAAFTFPGFEFRWQPNPTIQHGYPHTSPGPKLSFTSRFTFPDISQPEPNAGHRKSSYTSIPKRLCGVDYACSAANVAMLLVACIDEQFIDLRREQSWMSASMNGVNELARSGELRGYSSRPSAPRMQVIMGNSMCSARSK